MYNLVDIQRNSIGHSISQFMVKVPHDGIDKTHRQLFVAVVCCPASQAHGRHSESERGCWL